MNKMDFVCEGGIWEKTHPTIKLLLKRLLQPDPQKRISSSDVRFDPWVLFWDMKHFNKVENKNNTLSRIINILKIFYFLSFILNHTYRKK